MHIELSSPTQFEIIKFLYQFKDDNKFYKLDKNTLNIQSKNEKYSSIYTLRDNALIATDSEVYYNHAESTIVDFANNAEEIRAKILPKGIAVVESLMKTA